MTFYSLPYFTESIGMPENSSRPFYCALLSSAAFLLGYLLVSSTGSITSLEPGLVVGGASRWCEAVSEGMFREPSNAFSNIGFMISGLIMFRVLSSETTRKRQAFYGIRKTTALYAAAVVFLGPGSMLMHGTHTEWGQWADNLGMVAFIVFPWLYNLRCMGGWSENRFLGVYAVVVLGYAGTRWFYGDDLGIGLDLFGLSIGLWVISECLHRFWSPAFRLTSGLVGFAVAAAFGFSPLEIAQNPMSFWWVVLFWVPAVFAKHAPVTTRIYTPWFFLGVSTYVVAFLIWLNQWSVFLCHPDSWLQPHAVWHVLAAVSTWFFFLFFRTETGAREVP